MKSFLGGNSGRQKKSRTESSIGKKKKFEQHTISNKEKGKKTGEFKVAHDIVLSRSIRSRLLFIAQTEL